jgi:CCR4-NOT complex subunit CAF16
VTSAIICKKLRFHYPKDERNALADIDWQVPVGARVLLCGPNGAGKTTLLRVLAGLHMVDPAQARVLGRSAFHDTSLSQDLQYLGGVFPFTEDVIVQQLIDGVRGADPKRVDRLIDVLGVDPNWHMHRVSDGQRRRVQLLLGLSRRRQLLLLDEVSTDLDLLARARLLDFLREESVGGRTTIVYASHVLERLENWVTHLAYVSKGVMVRMDDINRVTELAELRSRGVDSPLCELVLGWLVNETNLIP